MRSLRRCPWILTRSRSGSKALMERLGLAGRAQAVLYATRQGLVPAELRPYLV